MKTIVNGVEMFVYEVTDYIHDGFWSYMAHPEALSREEILFRIWGYVASINHKSVVIGEADLMNVGFVALPQPLAIVLNYGDYTD